MNADNQPPDVGIAIHYNAVPQGTTVYDDQNVAVGTVRQVVDNYREHILDGVVISDNDGGIRFVDGPEVTRTFERGVFLSINAAEVAQLEPPENGPGVFSANRASGRLSKLFGGAWKRK